MRDTAPEHNQTVATFKDKTGDVWTVELDVDAIRKAKRETGVDLAAMFTVNGLAELANPETLVIFDVIFSLVESQANARHVTAKDFAKRFCGQTIEDAETALIDAALDFLPPGRAEPLRRIRERAAEVQAKAAELVTAKIAQMTALDILKPPPSGGDI